MISAVVGINWGDEGKGRMVDLLSRKYDIISRYQGGNNAGHTVVNERGKFILNLLPSGILRDETVNVMGPGMVIDIEHLCGEIKSLTDKGIKISPEHLVISDKATICMPFHKMLDGLEEDRMGDKKQGSTRRGIAPAYSDKYMRKAIRMGDLLSPDTLREKVDIYVDWKNILVRDGYGADEITTDDMMDWLKTYGDVLVPYIKDTTAFLNQQIDAGKSVMFEAQLGTLRDIDFGMYPYSSSSSTIAAYAPIGAGIPGRRLDSVLGITKAYSSCVGGGPFVCEMFGEEGDALREAGGEYGAATGRPRRVGGFDVVATKYGVMMQGATELALTKLDVLSYFEKIPVCEAYEIDSEIVHDFPVGDRLERAKPVYSFLDGFCCDISKCKKKSELPENAIKYIEYIEKAVGCKVRYLSVGPEREQYIDMAQND